jgi:hypothetical protein
VIHAGEPCDALLTALGARRNLLDIPQIGEDTPALEMDAIFECVFYCL